MLQTKQKEKINMINEIKGEKVKCAYERHFGKMGQNFEMCISETFKN